MPLLVPYRATQHRRRFSEASIRRMKGGESPRSVHGCETTISRRTLIPKTTSRKWSVYSAIDQWFSMGRRSRSLGSRPATASANRAGRSAIADVAPASLHFSPLNPHSSHFQIHSARFFPLAPVQAWKEPQTRVSDASKCPFYSGRATCLPGTDFGATILHESLSDGSFGPGHVRCG
jgi:hypothetical protein